MVSSNVAMLWSISRGWSLTKLHLDGIGKGGVLRRVRLVPSATAAAAAIGDTDDWK